MHDGSGKRSAATRKAIVSASNRLFLERRLRRIRVSHVAAEAGVGRSTLYDHFSGAEPLHEAALTPLFAILADAAAGRGNPAAIERLGEAPSTSDLLAANLCRSGAALAAPLRAPD